MARKITPEALAVAKSRMRYDPETGYFHNIKTGRVLGSPQGSGYWAIPIFEHGEVYAHRLAWFFVYGFSPVEIDHENRNRSDNRLCNLRNCTKLQNACNSPKRAHSKQPYKGVRLTKSGAWQARIRVNNECINVGHFPSAREAYEEYIFAALKHHGEYASFE